MKIPSAVRIFVLVATALYADYDEKGMKVYKKLCMSCHGSPEYGASQLEQSEWEDLFMFNAAKLYQAHAKKPDVAAKMQKYAGSKKFRHLQTFLVESAKDSGHVGGCDGNRCGISSGVAMKRTP